MPGQVAGLGRNGAEAANLFAGALDDIGVWNRALTADEISYLASGQPIPSAAQPLIISTAGIEGGRIVIQWSGGEGPYQLQPRPALTSGTWENVGNTVSGTSASDAVAGQIMFYRVIKAP